MSADAAPLHRFGRIDERLLWPGTGPRFILLMVLFVTSSATVASTITHSLTDPHNMSGGCALAAGADPQGDFLSVGVATIRADSAFRACLDRFVPHASGWLVPSAVALLVVTAGVLYWTLPLWKQRRRRLVPVEAIDRHGELPAVLEELAGVAGLTRRPLFVVAPAARTASAVVFGRWRRHVVCLHGGLVAVRQRDPRTFSAVVLHELAHIRNRDVDITYATVALWRVFLVTVLPGYVVSAVLALHASLSSPVFAAPSVVATTRDLTSMAVMIALVFLVRADILRTRELYADAGALRWGADPAVWPGATDEVNRDRGRLATLRRAFFGVWRSHPGWQQRREALADAEELFRPWALTLFLTGATASTCAAQLYTFGSGWLVRLAADMVAALVATTVGVSLWRAAAWAVLRGDPAPSGLRAGWWLGVGLMLGEVLTGSVSGWRVLPRHPEVFALLVVISVVVTCWTSQFAVLALRCWRGNSLRPVFAVGLLATLVVFALSYEWWQTSGRLFAAGWPYSESAIRRAVEQDLPGPALGHSTLTAIAVVMSVVLPWVADMPLVWAVTALWVLPLLTWAAGVRGSAPAWVVRALPPAHSAAWQAGRLPSFRRLALAAVLGGGVACAAVVVVLARLHSVRPPAGAMLGQQVLLLTTWLVVVLVAVVVATAAATGTAASRFPVPAAAVAAGTTGAAGLTVAFLLLSADGCLSSLATLRSSCAWTPGGAWPLIEVVLPLVLGLAVFVSAFTAVAGMAVRHLLRALRGDSAGQARRSPLRPARSSGRFHRLCRTAAVALTCLTALTLTTAASLPLGADAGSGVRSSLTRQDLAPAPHTTPSAQVLALETDAWLRLGGRTHLAGMSGELLAILNALDDDRAFTDRGYAAHAIRPHCLRLDTTAQQLSAYFPLPDPALQRQWPHLLAQARSIGVTCRQAIDEGKQDLYIKSMKDILGLTERVSAVLHGLTLDSEDHTHAH
ncbi:M48 family metalloprotease [Streptomyces sp. NBC_00557]|uniref:M48 family metalloprotease n=1 Tax=Streptomyces sp. NBC_00557 TaxID=2975776 RepID=UPI002E816314|nr:M48 family metalloprotease [Streptomyces sp. NBC_00557]WUC39293.1 M48 family metalloprotease [Streptomyces sp. NBC_00557]